MNHLLRRAHIIIRSAEINAGEGAHFGLLRIDMNRAFIRGENLQQIAESCFSLAIGVSHATAKVSVYRHPNDRLALNELVKAAFKLDHLCRDAHYWNLRHAQ